jgi:hypothetical protein
MADEFSGVYSIIKRFTSYVITWFAGQTAEVTLTGKKRRKHCLTMRAIYTAV